MSEFLNEWFQWLEKGVNSLSQQDKEKLFCDCGRNCADTGIIKVYEKLFLDSGKNFDMFFSRLNEVEYVDGNVITPGKIYEIIFQRCLCELHTLGYVHSDYICECSRQSIIHVMETLEPEYKYQVEKIYTILNGDKECRFRITII